MVLLPLPGMPGEAGPPEGVPDPVAPVRVPGSRRAVAPVVDRHSLVHSHKARSKRRVWPIHAYVGPNGGGKSCAMVWDTLPTLAAGREVLSTVRLLDLDRPGPCDGTQQDGAVPCTICRQEELTGEPYPHKQAHPGWVPLVDWQQLLDARGVDVLLDEVTGVASSRESAGLPAAVANKLVQLRRADVVVRWSAPAWARADKIIRECSQAVTFCTGHWSKAVEGDEHRQWRQRRLFRWRTFDATLFDDFTAGKRENLSVEGNDWHWGPSSPAFHAYDTYDAVSTVGTVTDAGRCYRCGGRRSIPTCKCGDVHS